MNQFEKGFQPAMGWNPFFICYEINGNKIDWNWWVK